MEHYERKRADKLKAVRQRRFELVAAEHDKAMATASASASASASQIEGGGGGGDGESVSGNAAAGKGAASVNVNGDVLAVPAASLIDHKHSNDEHTSAAVVADQSLAQHKERAAAMIEMVCVRVSLASDTIQQTELIASRLVDYRLSAD
jgi:hypothetical protein